MQQRWCKIDKYETWLDINFSMTNQHEHLYWEPGEREHDGDNGDQLHHPSLVPQRVLAHTRSTSLEVI